ncbi:DUF2612 domain-containing protein [uncultured Desulfovibrio sp.]|uniref:DUF2612 domain-containing protein n=1 Tax=uncultured Desulfovibrio sp. TaxID=167968 RepID=UPI00263563FA|nr:DUF2612 domain-containing protein [uncultured Desulfovibrio sp.]
MSDHTSRYVALVTSEHRKPRFLALVAALTGIAGQAQDLLAEIAAGFALDDAAGAQLDATGRWIGRTRRLQLPMDGDAVWFAWDVENRGWGEAGWRGRYDTATELVCLPDAPFRTLLRAKVAANSWDGSIPDAYRAWDMAFGDAGGVVLVQDNADMSLTLALLGMDVDAATRALFAGGYLPLKPEGVRLAGVYLQPPRPPGFGFDLYDSSVRGVDEGHWRDGERDGFAPLFAWNTSGRYLGGWRTGHWGLLASVSGRADAGRPAFAFNAESLSPCSLSGWQAGYWGGSGSADATDSSLWWGGRLAGDGRDGVLRRQSFAFNVAGSGFGDGTWI